MATTTLVCKQCNFENEPERVYCHNCGAKLDRSLLPPEATKRSDPVLVQERVRKMVNPRRGSGLKWLRNLILSAAVAALVAGLIVMLEPPDEIPVIDKDAAQNAPTITDDMDGLVAQGSTGLLKYSEENVNAFLQSTIHGKRDGSSGFSPLKFDRAYVRFDEGVVKITYVQTLFGLPVYATTVDSVAIKNGQAVGTPSAMTFGRLKVPTKVVPYIGGLFNPLWKVLERDKNLIAKMESITFHKGKVEMVSKAAGH